MRLAFRNALCVAKQQVVVLRTIKSIRGYEEEIAVDYRD